jgi:hypothetical protein
MAALKDLPNSPQYAGKLNDPATRDAMQKELSAKSKRIKELLRGTVAEPLVEQEDEQLRRLLDAKQRRDDPTLQEAMKQVKDLGTQIELLLQQATNRVSR